MSELGGVVLTNEIQEDLDNRVEAKKAFEAALALSEKGSVDVLITDKDGITGTCELANVDAFVKILSQGYVRHASISVQTRNFC